MAKISAKDVAKLRKMTGAGMMDCKRALGEANGDFEEAIDVLRKKGQKVAGKRAERDASEGAVLAKTNSDSTKAIIVALNCETDFVAKNKDFIKFTQKILDIAVEKNPSNLDELKELEINGTKISEEITNQIGIIGEKLELSYFDKIEAEYTTVYIHPGNKLVSIAGFNKNIFDNQVAKDVVMQIAAMAPVAIDKNDVPQNVIDKEIEIGREQAIQEGKPEKLAEMISKGKLNKFFKDNTLLNQQFIKNNKQTVKDYLKTIDKNLSVTSFKRYLLG